MISQSLELDKANQWGLAFCLFEMINYSYAIHT